MIPSSPTGGLPPKRKLECKTCQRSFHKTEHLKVKPYRYRTHNLLTMLQRHERSRMDRAPSVIALFANSCWGSLDTGLKPFVCQVCQRAFSRHDSLIRHDAIHVRKGDSVPIRSTHRAPPAPMAMSPVVTHDFVSHDGSQFTDSPIDSPTDFIPMSTNIYGRYEPQSSGQAGGSSQWSAETPPSTNLVWIGCNDFYEKIVAPADTSPVQPSQYFASASKTSLTGADLLRQEPLSPVFLDRCLVAFFDGFLPSFPIFPRPTFPFQEHAPSVLISAMAVGSLYVGEESFCDGGEALWRQAQSMVQYLQQFLGTQNGPTGIWQDFQLIATTLLCRIYATLTNSPQNRISSATLSGSITTRAHQQGLFNGLPTDVEPPIPIPKMSTGIQDTQKYSSAREVCSRVLSGSYIVDGFGSYLSDQSFPLSALLGSLEVSVNDLRFDIETTPQLPSKLYQRLSNKFRLEEIFYRLSTTVANPEQLLPNISVLSLHTLISHPYVLDLMSNATNSLDAGSTAPSKVVIQQALLHTKELISKSSQITSIQRVELLLRWHTIYLIQTVDVRHVVSTLSHRVDAQLPSFLSAADFQPRNFTPMDLQSWSSTSGARVCLLHAIAIHNLLSRLPQQMPDQADGPSEPKRSQPSMDSQDPLIDPSLAAASQPDPLIDPQLLQLESQMQSVKDSALYDPSQNLPPITPFSIHLPQSLLIACSTLIGLTISSESPRKVVVPAVVHWQDVLFADLDPNATLGEFAKSSESPKTRDFVQGRPSSCDEAIVEHDLIKIIEDFKKMLRDLARWFPVAAEMEGLLDTWTNADKAKMV